MSASHHTRRTRQPSTLHDQLAGPSTSSSVNGKADTLSKRFSLAHELSAAYDPNSGRSSARELAEEFGIDLEEEETEGSEEDPLGRQDPYNSPSSSAPSTFHQDLQFAQPLDDDLEATLFSSSSHHHHPGFDPDSFSDPYEQDIPGQGLSLGDEFQNGFGSSPVGSSLADGFDVGPEDGRERNVMTPTKISGAHRRRGSNLKGSRRGGSSRTMGTLMKGSRPVSASSASPTLSASLSKSRFDESSSDNDDDDGDEAEHDAYSTVPPRNPFDDYSPQSTISSPPSTPSLLAHILLPSTFLSLLSKEDTSFELERATTSLIFKMEDMSRQREGMNREWSLLDKESWGAFGESHGYGFAKFLSGDREGLRMGDHDPVEFDGLPSSSSADSRSLGNLPEVAEETASFSSPTFSRFPSTPSHHSGLPTKQPYSFSPSTSFETPPKDRSPIPLILTGIQDLQFSTSTLLTSLSAVHDASQISLSLAADAGRRLRSLKTSLGGMKTEEDTLERARKEVGDWEEHRRSPGTGLKRSMEKEMDGFRKAIDDFEEKTQALRATHETFLRGIHS